MLAGTPDHKWSGFPACETLPACPPSGSVPAAPVEVDRCPVAARSAADPVVVPVAMRTYSDFARLLLRYPGWLSRSPRPSPDSSACTPYPLVSGPFLLRRVDPVRQSPRSRMYGYFTHGTVPPPRPYSSGFLALPDYLRRLPSPTHFRRRLLGHTIFVVLVVLHSRPSTDRASLATSLSLIGPLTPASSRDPVSPPEVTCCSSVPCHPQSPWYGG